MTNYKQATVRITAPERQGSRNVEWSTLDGQGGILYYAALSATFYAGDAIVAALESLGYEVKRIVSKED